MRKNFIIVLILIFGFGSVVLAAPYFRQESSLIPKDSTENIGTSTAPWDEGHFNRICLTADCKTAWPTGGTGSPEFDPASYGVSTTSVVAFLNGLISNGSTTIPYLGTGGVASNNGRLYSSATTTFSTGLSYSNGVVTNTGVLTESDPVVKAISGIVKSNGAAISAASNGTDYTLITANTCSAGNHVSQITAAGVITCSADTGSGGSFPFTPATNYAVNTSATSTPIWAQAGLFASSTSRFDKLSFNSATGTVLYTSAVRDYLTPTALPYITFDSNINVGFTGTASAAAQGGLVNIYAQDGGATSGTGGDIVSQAGTGFGGALGGSILTFAGSGGATGDGGLFQFLAGDGGATSGNGGIINLVAGNAPTNGDGGYVVVSGGYGNGTGKNGGDVKLIPGLTSGTGINGVVRIMNPSTGFYSTFDTSALATTDRSFVFPDEAGTFALGTGSAGNCASWSTTNTLTTTGSPCESGGGSAFPFTPATNYGVNTSATTTALWAQAGLFASSTSAYPTLAVSQLGAGPAATFMGGAVGIGSTTPWGLLSLADATYNYDHPLFTIATSSDAFGTLFSVSATTTENAPIVSGTNMLKA